MAAQRAMRWFCQARRPLKKTDIQDEDSQVKYIVPNSSTIKIYCIGIQAIICILCNEWYFHVLFVIYYHKLLYEYIKSKNKFSVAQKGRICAPLASLQIGAESDSIGGESGGIHFRGLTIEWSL